MMGCVPCSTVRQRAFVILTFASAGALLCYELLKVKGHSRAKDYFLGQLGLQTLGLESPHILVKVPPTDDEVEELSGTLISRLMEFVSDRKNLLARSCVDADDAGLYDQECSDVNCSASFQPSPAERLRQVLATRVQVPMTYQDAMTSAVAAVTSHKYVFVTAASSNHYYELQALLESVRRYLLPALTDGTYVFVVFDLVLDFPFAGLPRLVRHLTCYAWKPIAVTSLADKATDYLVWMDTSIRWTAASPVREIFGRARERGYQGLPDHGSLAVRTARSTFSFYGDPPCLYQPFSELLGGLHVFYLDRFAKEALLAPWMSCALDQRCMCVEDFLQQFHCSADPPRRLSRCHRFDQSSMGLVVSKLFSDQRPMVHVPRGAVKIAKTTADWFRPRKSDFLFAILFVCLAWDALFICCWRRRQQPWRRDGRVEEPLPSCGQDAAPVGWGCRPSDQAEVRSRWRSRWRTLFCCSSGVPTGLPRTAPASLAILIFIQLTLLPLCLWVLV